MTDKFKKLIENKNNRIFILILILGIVLMTVSGGDEKDTKDNTEERLEKILNSVENVDGAEVCITYSMPERSYGKEHAKPEAVIICIENAEDTYVKRTVSEAASAALSLPVHKVIILNKK